MAFPKTMSPVLRGGSFRFRSRLLRNGAFTLAQTLVSASILGTLGAVVLPMANDAYGDVSAVASELAGWLENVSHRSQLLTGQGCTISLQNTNESSLASGSILARVSPASCAQGDAKIPEFYLSNPHFLLKLVRGSSTITFTPRGTITSSGNTDLRIRKPNNSAMRCVRISAVLGFISLGSGTDPAPTDTTGCREDSYSAEIP